jgi:hypothetical protein
MKVGDLVTVLPVRKGVYIIAMLTAHSCGTELPNCVTLVSLNGPLTGYRAPMGREFIEVISPA